MKGDIADIVQERNEQDKEWRDRGKTEVEKEKGKILIYAVCKLACVDRLRHQEIKQDLCYIGCAATAYSTLLLSDK